MAELRPYARRWTCIVAGIALLGCSSGGSGDREAGAPGESGASPTDSPTDPSSAALDGSGGRAGLDVGAGGARIDGRDDTAAPDTPAGAIDADQGSVDAAEVPDVPASPADSDGPVAEAGIDGTSASDAVDSPVGPSCQPGLTLCDGRCTDLTTDPNNCLGCGTLCTGGKVCDRIGGCECPGVTTDCLGICTDLNNSALNCGQCGKACAAGLVCGGGACGCAQEQTDCGDGRCIDLTKDVANCGTCEHACGAGQVCTAGQCVCAAGKSDCKDGTCADLATDPANCGACGTSCATNRVCNAGTCSTECAAGLTDCNGACVDLQTSDANCGTCAVACGPGRACATGQCRCAAGRTDCGGVCVDLQVEIGNCGSCGHVCPSGSTCQNGACKCDPGFTLCGDSCVNTQWSADHCGTCTNACTGGKMCSQGSCLCPSPLVECNGVCTNPMIDAANCGGCGKLCTVGTCVNGTCSCPLYQSPCNGQCIPTANDPQNCGACGKVCPTGEVCLSSACTSTCYAGLTACSGTCVDTATDRNHCGSCANACATGQGCAAGACVAGVPVGNPPAKCANGGPPIVLTSDGTTLVCAGMTAATTFPWAICTCDSFTGKGSQTFDAFDSAAAPYVAGGLGGGVGVNGIYSGGSSMSCTGSLWSYQSIDPGNATIRQELHVGGALAGNVQVTGDGYAVTPQGRGTFSADLYTAACPATGYTVNGTCHAQPTLAVPAPCQRCDGANQVPVQAYVSYYATAAHNDNAAIGLSPSALSSGTTHVLLDLPCGYYYLDRIVSENSVTITAHGNTALFVGGGIDVKGALVLALDASSRFDLFIAGTLYAAGTLTMGSPAYPANLRVYLGGACKATGATCAQKADCCSGVCTGGLCTGASLLPEDPPWAMYMQAATNIAANLYTPNGEMYAGASFAMYGAVFAGDYKANGSTTIHYDRAAVDQGQGCPPPTGCTSCLDCSNQACVNGTCGECTSDGQCCPPLRCMGGRCDIGG